MLLSPMCHRGSLPCFAAAAHSLSLSLSLSPPPPSLDRGGGTEAPQVFRRGEHMGRVGFDPRKFFALGWQVTCVSSDVRRPFSSKENRRISERDDLGPPFEPGGQEIGLGPRNLERADRWLGRAGDGLGPLVCCRKECHKAKRRVEV
jgi:hypothetical protein